jgi:hypothetical protein
LIKAISTHLSFCHGFTQKKILGYPVGNLGLDAAGQAQARLIGLVSISESGALKTTPFLFLSDSTSDESLSFLQMSPTLC